MTSIDEIGRDLVKGLREGDAALMQRASTALDGELTKLRLRIEGLEQVKSPFRAFSRVGALRVVEKGSEGLCNILVDRNCKQ